MPEKNDLLLRAARGEKTERTPVWLMRQAGRYLSEYRAVREKAKGFKQMVKNPELAAEVTLQPVRILGVDAAIIFSDILVVAEGIGCDYEMEKDEGPVMKNPIRKISDIEKLYELNPEEHCGYVLQTIQLVKRELNDSVPLIGFAGAPWTIFAYMVEGRGSKNFSIAKSFLYHKETAAHKLLQKITDATILYLKAQIKSGADIIQIFDSWGGILNRDTYLKFSYPYLKQICDAITDVPKIIFPRGCHFAMEEFGKLNCEVVSLDWTMQTKICRQQLGGKKILQGNLDPCTLYGSYDFIKMETQNMLYEFGREKHIANLGHGIYPDTEVGKVKCFVDTVKDFK